MSKQHCRMLQSRTLLRQSRALLQRCCRFWQQCRRNVRLCCQKRQQCRTSFALTFRTFDKVDSCFDIVAGVDGASCIYCRQPNSNVMICCHNVMLVHNTVRLKLKVFTRSRTDRFSTKKLVETQKISLRAAVTSLQFQIQACFCLAWWRI